MDYENTYVYFANKNLHCIQRYNLINKKFDVKAGQCGKSGDRIGNTDLMLLNGP